MRCVKIFLTPEEKMDKKNTMLNYFIRKAKANRRTIEDHVVP